MQPITVIGSLLAATAVTAAPQRDAGAPQCAPLEMVVARGSYESKPYGFLAASAVYEATKKLIPEMTGYSVDYPAQYGEASPKIGIADVKRYFLEQPKACPKQKYARNPFVSGLRSGEKQGADILCQIRSRRLLARRSRPPSRHERNG
jgi:hypothetical protein